MDDATVKALVAKRRQMNLVRKLCDKQDLPYPPELCAYLTDVVRYRSGH